MEIAVTSLSRGICLLQNLKGFLQNLKFVTKKSPNSFAEPKEIFAQPKGRKHLMIGVNWLYTQQKFTPKNPPIKQLDQFFKPSELSELARALARPVSN